jgi:hypothetical protein
MQVEAKEELEAETLPDLEIGLLVRQRLEVAREIWTGALSDVAARNRQEDC